jgi:hypothetical protein
MSNIDKQAQGEKTREAFERWAEQSGALPWGILKKHRNQDGTYPGPHYTYMWHAWNACHEALLASLEAEPVAYIRDGFRADGVHFCGGIITAEEHERTKAALSDRYNWKHQPLYAAPPAPVSVPDENGLLPCPCCGGRAEFDYDDDNLNWISCNVCGISTDTAYHTDVDARDRLRDAWNLRAAMLQGAEPVTTAYKLPEGWVAVPIEPTYQMCEAMSLPWESPRFPNRYKAMIAAAPHFREIGNSSTKHFRENAETSTKCWCHTCRPVTIYDMRFVVCPVCGNKRCPHANDHRHACTRSNEPGQEGSAYPAAPQQEVK